ncbi:MAG TPA: type II secretion system F family protein [Pseudolabrys sp.]|nr:type II secretion system F family protein [Pseudolabrys sp.]
MFDFNPIYLVYLLIGASAALFVEGFYLVGFSKASYRSNINRRLQLLKDKPDRENILVQLRRERGLTAGGDYRLPLINLNQLVLQSGLTIGFSKLMIFIVIGMIGAFMATMLFDHQPAHALGAAGFAGVVLPVVVLKFLKGRRQKRFGAQFPDAIDMIVRSLKAGHPVPIAISMVAREFPDPVGTEFGIVADEITYGADLEGAMRNLYFRVGTDDLPLFITAVAIQGSTGGNLGEILQNLSSVIRLRFKMRRKVRALAAEGRASAMILSSLPIGMFAVINFVAPEFYASVWHETLTKIGLGAAGFWMLVGNAIMFRMVNFKI